MEMSGEFFESGKKSHNFLNIGKPHPACQQDILPSDLLILSSSFGLHLAFLYFKIQFFKIQNIPRIRYDAR